MTRVPEATIRRCPSGLCSDHALPEAPEDRLACLAAELHHPNLPGSSVSARPRATVATAAAEALTGPYPVKPLWTRVRSPSLRYPAPMSSLRRQWTPVLTIRRLA